MRGCVTTSLMSINVQRKQPENPLLMSGITEGWYRRTVTWWCLIERNTCMLLVPCHPGLDTIRTNLLSGRLVCYAAVSIPYFYSARAQRALPFKGGGSYSQLCLSIPRWSFKRTHSLGERERERGDSCIWNTMRGDGAWQESIEPLIPQPTEMSCPLFPLSVCRGAASTCWQSYWTLSEMQTFYTQI